MQTVIRIVVKQEAGGWRAFAHVGGGEAGSSLSDDRKQAILGALKIAHDALA